MRVGFAIAFVLVASVASAQVATAYVTQTYLVGAPSSMQSYTFQAAQVTCNVVKPTGLPTVNPIRVYWNDATNVGKVCTWLDTGFGPLFAAPIPGSYEMTVTAVNASGSSAESTRTAFSRSGAIVYQTPIAPANTRIRY